MTVFYEYPPSETLVAIGRVAIASARLHATAASLYLATGFELSEEDQSRAAGLPSAALLGRANKLARRTDAPLSSEERDARILWLEGAGSLQSERGSLLHADWSVDLSGFPPGTVLTREHLKTAHRAHNPSKGPQPSTAAEIEDLAFRMDRHDERGVDILIAVWQRMMDEK